MRQVDLGRASFPTAFSWLYGLFLSALLLAPACADDDMQVTSDAKEITAFAFLAGDNPSLSRDVRAEITGFDIAATLPAGADVTSLRPSIVFIGQSISPNGSLRRNFTDAVEYTVTASDGSAAIYTVRLSVRASPASAKDITKFTLQGVDAEIRGTSITLTLPYGTDVSALAPSVSFDGEKLSPASDTPQDFSKPVQYTVEAADGSTKTYTVTVNVAQSDSKDITSFKLAGVDGVVSGSSIAVTLPYGTDLTALTPEIVHTGASVDPASGAEHDFSAPVVFTVTAADGSTKAYTVTVSVAESSSKDITSFSILDISAQIGDSVITLTVPYGTNLSALTPMLSITGQSVSPANGETTDFTGPVTYTVTAADGSTKAYVVTLEIAPSDAKDITLFSVGGNAGSIAGSSISLLLPSGTNVTALAPEITHNGASVSPASGVATDFSAPVVYTVTAADGSSKQYTVTVQVAPATAKDITQFTILGHAGQISGSNISLTVPYGSNLGALTPVIVHTGASISPASGAVQDFSDAVDYTVTAADGSTHIYHVHVVEALSDANSITAFDIDAVSGSITGGTIALTLPFGTDVTHLAPIVVHTGVSVSPASGEPQDFTQPVTYRVTAADSSTCDYTVTVTVAKSGSRSVTSFGIAGATGQISGTDISLTLPYGTDLSLLKPDLLVHTGASISPAADSYQDFRQPVVYTVTAANDSTTEYTVHASVAPNTAKDITLFKILGIDADVYADTVTLVVPYGTDVTSLTPTIEISGASIAPISGAPQDFSAPVTYTVTAADSSTKEYSVSVTVALNSAKNITQLTLLGVDADISNTDLTVTVPFGTDITSLAPVIVHTGASVSPASGVAQDFSQPVEYTVTAADGTTKAFTLTVSVAPSSAKEITRFTLLGVDGMLASHAISLTLPYGTDVSSLTPDIDHTGASIQPGNAVPADFTSPLTYTVTAADGSTQDYVVTVNVALNDAKDITQFSLLGVDGSIVGTTITLTVPYGTNVSSLVPVLVHSGASISPNSGLAQDFSGPVEYTVTAADGGTKKYTVEVTVAASTAKDITQFSLLGMDAMINGTNITFTAPFGTDVMSLTPTITHSGASVSPLSGVPHDFSQPVTYTVTADDNSTQDYTVTVNVAPSNAKEITKFTVLGSDAMINGTDITLTLPYGTDLSALTPMIVITGASVSPNSGVVQSFSSPVIYTVVADDSSMNQYTVTITAAANATPVVSGGPFTHSLPVVNGDSIGTVQVNDADPGQTHSFALTADSSGGVFAIDASTGEITIADASMAMSGSFQLTVEATDNGVPAETGSVTVTVNFASPPTASADGPLAVFQNVSTMFDLAANDALGTPNATFTSFGGGSLGGAVTDHAADGSTVALGGGTISLDAAGSLTVNVATPGSYSFSYRIGNGTSSDATVTLTVCNDMAVGDLIVSRPEDAPTACVGSSSGSTSDYVFIPMNVAESGTYSLTVTTSNTATLSGSAPGAGSVVAGDGHAVFRSAQHTEVASRKGTTGSGTVVAPASSIPQSVPVANDAWSLNADVSTSCSSGTAAAATVKYVGTNVIVVAQNDVPAGGFTATQYQAFGWNFDNIIYPAVTTALGVPSDIDGNGRVVLYFTPAMNALAAPATAATVTTRHMARDLLSQTECPTSNVGEMIYILAPDPTGAVNSNVRTVSYSFGLSGAATAHEFAHLVLDSRRLAPNKPFEEPWLDEALASLGEELSFYLATRGMASIDTSGGATIPTPTGTALTEGQNIVLSMVNTGPDASRRVAAFNSFANPNYGRLRTFLLNPRRYGPVSATDPDTLAGRGAGWALIRYLDDRVAAGNLANGNAFVSALVDANTTGMTNLAQRINADPSLWLRDFLLALFVDDSGVPMLDTSGSPYRITSWSLTSLFTALNGSYAVSAAQLPVFTANTPVTFNLVPGGSASWVRFGGSANTPALVTMTPPSSGTWDAWYAIVRRQ